MPPATAPTVRDLDTRLDALDTRLGDLDRRLGELDRSYTDFRGRAETIILLSRWLVGFSAGAVLTLLLLSGSALYTAGKLDGQVISQGKQTEALGKQVERLEERTQQMTRDQERLNAKVDALTDLVKQIQADLRKPPGKQ